MPNNPAHTPFKLKRREFCPHCNHSLKRPDHLFDEVMLELLKFRNEMTDNFIANPQGNYCIRKIESLLQKIEEANKC